LVVVMAIGAIHQARRGPGREQARDVCVFADGDDGMVRRVDDVEIEARVRFDNLPGYARGTAIQAVGVAAETQLILLGERIHGRAGGANAGQSGETAGSVRRGSGGLLDGVRVVAVCALDVTRRIDRVFERVVDAARVRHRVHAEFVELGRDVFRGDGAAVAGVAILFLVGEVEQPGFRARTVRGVTVLARVRGHGRQLCVRPRVKAGVVPGFGRGRMRRGLPEIVLVALQAQGRGVVVLHEKFSVLIVV